MSSEDTSEHQESSTQESTKSLAYAWGVAVCLSFGYALSFLDRELLSLVIKPIKESFELTDFQVSLLLGASICDFLYRHGHPARLGGRSLQSHPALLPRVYHFGAS